MTDRPDIELVERLRADAATIRAHVPDADGSYLPVARSASEPERQMVAGPLHADMLEYAADRIERLSAAREEAIREAAAVAGRIDGLVGPPAARAILALLSPEGASK